MNGTIPSYFTFISTWIQFISPWKRYNPFFEQSWITLTQTKLVQSLIETGFVKPVKSWQTADRTANKWEENLTWAQLKNKPKLNDNHVAGNRKYKYYIHNLRGKGNSLIRSTAAMSIDHAENDYTSIVKLKKKVCMCYQLLNWHNRTMHWNCKYNVHKKNFMLFYFIYKHYKKHH